MNSTERKSAFIVYFRVFHRVILDTSNFFTFLSKTKSEYLDRLIVEVVVFNLVFPDMHHFSIWICQNLKKSF